MIILGISAYYHDSAAVLIDDNEILSAVQEERFSRKKGDSNFPTQAIQFCLKNSDLTIKDIDAIVYYEKPFIKFERLIETTFANAPRGFKMFKEFLPVWLKDKINIKQNILYNLKKIDKEFNFDAKKIYFSDHHLSHAASTFYTSNFNDAVVIVFDGVGEWKTTSISIAENNNIKPLKEINYPNSIGLLYSAFTYFCGFKVNSGEYKLMGLAPYGKPKYKETILENLIDLKDDGSFMLNQKYFNYNTGLTMTNEQFSKLFDIPRRKTPDENIDLIYADLASSIQQVTEEIILKIINFSKKFSNSKNLCLSGGVALNCVVNGKIHKNCNFKNIWIQPAAGDSGGALGAALAFRASKSENKKIFYNIKGSNFGPSFKEEEIRDVLEKENAVFHCLDENSLIKKISNQLKNEKIIGWFQDRMEYGPRALGFRSILADPRSSKMQKDLNLKIKFREGFRPFAPAIIDEECEKYFNFEASSDHMLYVATLHKKYLNSEKNSSNQDNILSIVNEKRSDFPAITHVDNSSRIQTVKKENNSKFYKLLKAYYDITGCPMLVNTSFNVRGEPIVCNPLDAFKCFMTTNLDVLVLENILLIKSEQVVNNYEALKFSYLKD